MRSVDEKVQETLERLQHFGDTPIKDILYLFEPVLRIAAAGSNYARTNLLIDSTPEEIQQAHSLLIEEVAKHIKEGE